MKHMLYVRKAVPMGLLFFCSLRDMYRFFPVNNVYLRYHLHTIERRTMMGKEYVCVCPIFTSESIEFIPAWSVVGRLHKKSKSNTSNIQLKF